MSNIAWNTGWILSSPLEVNTLISRLLISDILLFCLSCAYLICPCRTASARKCRSFLAQNTLQHSRKITLIRRQVGSPRSKESKGWLEKGLSRFGEDWGGEEVSKDSECWIPEAFRKIRNIRANAFFSILILANLTDFFFGLLGFVNPVLKKLFLLCYIESIKPKWSCKIHLGSVCCINTRYCSALFCDTCVPCVLKNGLHLYVFIK